jgi:hypothetical protein
VFAVAGYGKALAGSREGQKWFLEVVPMCPKPTGLAATNLKPRTRLVPGTPQLWRNCGKPRVVEKMALDIPSKKAHARARSLFFGPNGPGLTVCQTPFGARTSRRS